jgi:hypothetical protein
LTYFILIGILRPYESKVDMFIEIMNEVFYIHFIVFLWGYKTEDSWGTSSTDAFFWLLISNNALIAIILNCVQIATIVTIIKRKFSNIRNRVYEKRRQETRDKIKKTLDSENEKVKTPSNSSNLAGQQVLSSSSNLMPSKQVIFKEKYNKNFKMVNFEQTQQKNDKLDPSFKFLCSNNENIITKNMNSKTKYSDQVSYADNPEHAKSL